MTLNSAPDEISFADDHTLLCVPFDHPRAGLSAEKLTSAELLPDKDSSRFQIHGVGRVLPLMPGDVVRAQLTPGGCTEVTRVESFGAGITMFIDPLSPAESDVDPLSLEVLQTIILRELGAGGFALVRNVDDALTAWAPTGTAYNEGGLHAYFKVKRLTPDRRKKLVNRYLSPVTSSLH
ncbi:hypothetical protein [Corynebacterium guangdongense]|uniref:Uncharacterized protein n=1 Tax=Corynebacterium guangdongense TaxID=1783348 RepID=A0ABU1ZV02_9CORY|nr:hypothetical protein [Corynebacterium guangdongense]MDR7328755.1 hypothetical protein [Corynebacterium guangdongense]WJZ17331.1 hypothetical protein CGUA_03680 [Corynebacterium guangdongense]